MQEETKQGYVYILTNPSFREDWVKIGKAKNIDERVKTLDNTSVPLPFEVFATMKTSKYHQAEKLVHKYIERFTNLRIRNNREFFNVKPETALEIFKDVSLLLDDVEIDEVYKKDLVDEHESGHKTIRLTNGENRVWLIPSNQKYFDLESCFKKYGKVYWSQYYNYHKGDIGYIYSSIPNSTIRYKIVMEETDLPSNPNIDVESVFFVDKKDIDILNQHNRFAHFRLIGETKNSRLGLAYLLNHGMKMAPRGAMNLSYKGYEELKKYIEDNF